MAHWHEAAYGMSFAPIFHIKNKKQEFFYQSQIHLNKQFLFLRMSFFRLYNSFIFFLAIFCNPFSPTFSNCILSVILLLYSFIYLLIFLCLFFYTFPYSIVYPSFFFFFSFRVYFSLPFFSLATFILF